MLQQNHIKALTPTWLLVKAATAPPRGGSAKKPAPVAAYSPPLLLSPSAWQKAQDDEKKGKDAGRVSGMPASPRMSCMGQVKGTRKGCSSSARGVSARGSGHGRGNGGALTTLFLGLFGRRNGRASRACPKVRDVPRVGSASAPGRSHGCGSVTAVAVLDPPLPVVRRPARGDDAPSLWERRRGGGKALENLRLPYTAATESS